jgi:transcriptional regulator with XRE-family HTH domain
MTEREISSLGANLGLIRKRKGKSLETVAQLAGVRPEYLRTLEGGQQLLVELPLIVSLADAVGESAEDLLLMALRDYRAAGANLQAKLMGGRKRG